MAYQEFTDQQQAGFLLQMETLGYPENKYAPMKIAKQKGAPSGRTLRRWWAKRHKPSIANVVRQEKVDFVDALQHLLNLHITAASEAVVGSEDLRAIDTGIGILVDKLQILTGGATSNENHRILIGYSDIDND